MFQFIVATFISIISFFSGKTPSHAISHFIEKLRGEFPDPLQFQKAIIDRSQNPQSDFYNLYTQHFKEAFGAKNGQEMIAALDKSIEELQSLENDFSFYKQDFDSDLCKPFIFAFVTPFMKRVHSMVRIQNLFIHIYF